jgi:hypothetical protein
MYGSTTRLQTCSTYTSLQALHVTTRFVGKSQGLLMLLWLFKPCCVSPSEPWVIFVRAWRFSLSDKALRQTSSPRLLCPCLIYLLLAPPSLTHHLLPVTPTALRKLVSLCGSDDISHSKKLWMLQSHLKESLSRKINQTLKPTCWHLSGTQPPLAALDAEYAKLSLSAERSKTWCPNPTNTAPT